MDPILLIHGYSTEGKDSTPRQIYGTLPAELRKRFGRGVIREINLSRWISLSDGVSLDDVSFAMDRDGLSGRPLGEWIRQDDFGAAGQVSDCGVETVDVPARQRDQLIGK